MKILIVHHCDSWGGAGVSLRDMCMMLSNTHELTVCLPHINSEVGGELNKIDKINIVEIGCDMGMISAYNGGPSIMSRTFFKNLLKIKESRKRLEKIMEVKRYDAVILNSITLAWATELPRRHGAMSILYIRETKVKNIAYYRCCSMINKYCDGILFISNFDQKNTAFTVKSQCVVKDCFTCKDYTVTATREEACEKLGLDSGKFNLLYVGGTNELKGHSVIISAMSMCDDNNVQLIVAGDTEENKKATALNITYIGKIYDMPMLYRACDVLIFPSIKAHQARPAFEAGAMGLPVIISDFPETAEEIKRGENGLTFESCNSEALMKCIKALSSDRDLAIKLGKKNYENAMAKHEFEACKAKLVNFLHDI